MDSTRNPEVLRLKLKSKRLSPPVADAARQCLHWLFGFRQFNKIYSGVPPCERLQFSHAFLESLGVRLELSGAPMDTVPDSGPLVIVANHPFGMIEGFAVDALLGSKRPDGALMAVHVLASIPEYQGRLIVVGPRGRRSRRKRSVNGWREAFKLLRRGGALAVFPAGGVARFQWRHLSVSDPPWSPHVAALVRRTGAAVLPVYFHGRNGWMFQLVGILCRPLQDLMIVGELAKMRGRTLRVTVGRVVQPGELSHFATDEESIAFLRAETEMLARS